LIERLIKWSVITLAIVFALLQFVQPAKTNPQVNESRTIQAHAEMPPEVSSIFARSCNDCHSNKTTWPWYSNVAPFSWFVTDHVNEGRRHLNFSDWSRLNEREAAGQLDQICREVKEGGMPLTSYILIHRNAKLSHQDIQTICNWTTRANQMMNDE
jgi:cytochrome c551/c552